MVDLKDGASLIMRLAIHLSFWGSITIAAWTIFETFIRAAL